ncbi:hypothetical protein UCRPC4_g00850 [Phaeomoniella chlamydospora]|uniref:Uncharacterized protein n=1 Tax=Phaeomoniella chlamydospora TaxID=158046 RepID=A0A0G2EYD4_PHACM|nr:hypothetical protein UCRPC4_g00850 [Phaeomoniella chlamydospora]
MDELSFIGDECLMDTSWSLYRVTQVKIQGKDLRNPSAFAQPARDLDSLLQKTAKGGAEYDEEDSDHAGGYLKSTWRIIRTSANAGGKARGILISVNYDRSMYKAALLLNRQRGRSNPAEFPLLLLRMPPTLAKRFLGFFESDLSATFQPLKLASHTLSKILESYIDTLSYLPSASNLPSYTRESTLQDLPSQLIRDVKVTLAFNAPISPHLRSLDIDIPFETVWKLVQPEVTNAHTQTIFLQRLGQHLDRTMGIKVPWHTNEQPNSSTESSDGYDLIRISKIACASIVITSDGKMKIVDKFSEAVSDEEMVQRIEQANKELLNELLSQASAG